MPDIPRYVSEMTPQVRGAQLYTPSGAVGRAFVELGRTVVQIGAKFKRAEEVTQYNESMRGLREDLTELRFSYAERSDFENFQEDFQKDSSTIAKKYFEEMKDNSLWGSFEPQMDGAIISTEVAVRIIHRRKQVDYGRASYASTMETLADEYGKATDMEKTNILVQAEDATRMNKEVGYISQQEAQKAIRDFKYNAMKSDAWYLARAMGFEEGIKWLQNEKNAPRLTREDRNSMVAHLRRDWNIERVENKERERKLNNLTYEKFLEQMVAWENDKENPLPSHAEVVDSPITDPKMKAQLMAYLDSVEKAENPFLNSDPKVFGEVISSLYLSPEDWNEGEIIKYMGKGLSVQHTLYALKEYERLTKVPAPKKDSQLALGIRILNRAAAEGMFIGKDLKTEATDLEIINNYSMHAKTLSELISRANAEEDPIAVTKELMKPYVDRKIERWIKRAWRSFFDTKEYKEEYIREEAIQQLQEEGELVTEDTISETIEKIRKRNVGEEEETIEEGPLKELIEGIKEKRNAE